MKHVQSDTWLPGKRIRSIQYLRAIAALSVVAYHAGKRVETELSEAALALFHLGHVGADLFFVISGFIMWSIGRDAPRHPGDFLLRRAIRVVPPYWIATISWVAVMLVAGVGWIVITPAHVVMSLLFIPHWSPTFAGTFWPVLVPGWTLLFEMFFYTLFALTLLVAPRWRLASLTSMLLFLVSTGVATSSTLSAVQAYTSPLLLEFLAGCWIAEFWRRGFTGLWFGIGLCVIGGLILVFLSPLAVPDQTSWGRPLTFGVSG
ncbi:MAG: acyltransferase, partial [Pseudomonadota bacterium]